MGNLQDCFQFMAYYRTFASLWKVWLQIEVFEATLCAEYLLAFYYTFDKLMGLIFLLFLQISWVYEKLSME